ncbi:MAG: hypothetical protein ACRDWI_08290 [Jiangellaceae bacterium]
MSQPREGEVEPSLLEGPDGGKAGRRRWPDHLGEAHVDGEMFAKTLT